MVVPAPVECVYDLLTYFHRYPQFMRHVKSVTYYDDQNSHWVVDVDGPREWDAINEGWRTNSRIGWRATRGPKNAGEILFDPIDDRTTRVFVRLQYDPSGGAALERALQEDLERFAKILAQTTRKGRSLTWEALREPPEVPTERGVTARASERV